MPTIRAALVRLAQYRDPGAGAVITALIAYCGMAVAAAAAREVAPFIGAVWLFAMSYLGIAISLWPMIVPYQFTLWEAASSEATQAFLLVGTLFLLPVILMYTGWSYWVFRGKVRAISAITDRLSRAASPPATPPASPSRALLGRVRCARGRSRFRVRATGGAKARRSTAAGRGSRT